MKAIILSIVFIGLFSLAAADYQCSTESYASYRQFYGKN